MIKYKGLGIAPAEIEALLFEHPAVADVALIGKPDAEAGEVLKAFVVQKGPDVTADDLLAWARGRLAGHKTLHEVEFVDSIPKTASGKILRRVLKEEQNKRLGPLEPDHRRKTMRTTCKLLLSVLVLTASGLSYLFLGTSVHAQDQASSVYVMVQAQVSDWPEFERYQKAALPSIAEERDVLVVVGRDARMNVQLKTTVRGDVNVVHSNNNPIQSGSPYDSFEGNVEPRAGRRHGNLPGNQGVHAEAILGDLRKTRLGFVQKIPDRDRTNSGTRTLAEAARRRPIPYMQAPPPVYSPLCLACMGRSPVIDLRGCCTLIYRSEVGSILRRRIRSSRSALQAEPIPVRRRR